MLQSKNPFLKEIHRLEARAIPPICLYFPIDEPEIGLYQVINRTLIPISRLLQQSLLFLEGKQRQLEEVVKESLLRTYALLRKIKILRSPYDF